MVSVLDDSSGPLAMIIVQPDTDKLWSDIGARLRQVGIKRISPREWKSLVFNDSPCTVHVAAGRLVRLFTGRSSLYAADLPLTERWVAAATGRGRVVFGLVPPQSLPDTMVDIDLTGDPEAIARVDELAAERHLVGGLARLVAE